MSKNQPKCPSAPVDSPQPFLHPHALPNKNGSEEIKQDNEMASDGRGSSRLSNQRCRGQMTRFYACCNWRERACHADGKANAKALNGISCSSLAPMHEHTYTDTPENTHLSFPHFQAYEDTFPLGTQVESQQDQDTQGSKSHSASTPLSLSLFSASQGHCENQMR